MFVNWLTSRKPAAAARPMATDGSPRESASMTAVGTGNTDRIGCAASSSASPKSKSSPSESKSSAAPRSSVSAHGANSSCSAKPSSSVSAAGSTPTKGEVA
jgi:hypothetical protein